MFFNLQSIGTIFSFFASKFIVFIPSFLKCKIFKYIFRVYFLQKFTDLLAISMHRAHLHFDKIRPYIRKIFSI